VILNNAPQHEAVMSNVNEIGEFRIRNSAKAFNILSSGLYANKIRAIIRELSCNAVDSHVAAGRADVPFDVHLPNTIDPTFRIRDYGTGLSHEQVLNIYTTYFESTKTESNQFIGALGLGSKSPFSYTDNFTVTAIKDSVRNVYSAFINGEGVPSIALMHSESTTEANGVEVQFAVTDRWDFDKFRGEAREVYTHFKLRPVVSGGEREFEFRDVEYKDRNIIPGVHYLDSGRSSRAVMGNIAYPIDVPNSETNLGKLARLLGCGLEMHFDIGELDFQASREGLSYIPSTIDAIKRKLIALEAQLAVHLTLEADAIENDWEKCYFLRRRSSDTLWSEAARAYIANSQFDMIDVGSTNYISVKPFTVDVKDLAARYNISILGFGKSTRSSACHDLKTDKKHHNNTYTSFDDVWTFRVEPGTIFVVNDTKKGALARAKNHWRRAAKENLPTECYEHHVYVLSPATKGHVMDTMGFFAELDHPPGAQMLMASQLMEKERKDSSGGRAKNVRIMRLSKKDYGRRDIKTVWDEAGQADQYDSNETFYYIPLSGYTAIDVKMDPKELYENLARSGITELKNMAIYGVRKGDIDWVREQSNWVLAEDYIADVLKNLSAETLGALATSEVDVSGVFKYNAKIASAIINPNSPFVRLMHKFKGTEKTSFSKYNLDRLLKIYTAGVNIDSIIESIQSEKDAVKVRYPLLSSLREYSVNESAVAEYINLIDSTKGI